MFRIVNRATVDELIPYSEPSFDDPFDKVE